MASRNQSRNSAPEETTSALDTWAPKTNLGRKVKNKEIMNIDEIIRME